MSPALRYCLWDLKNATLDEGDFPEANPDIARLLGISPDTVKQHLNAIFIKLGAANRSEAVAIALK